LAKSVIIARLLFPHDVGLFGLASLTLSVSEVFFQTGFSAAIVQEPGEVEKHLNSVWTLNIIRGFFLAALVYVAAPWAGTFFNNAEMVSVARVLSLIFIITAFDNPGVFTFEREMRFDRKFFYDVYGVLIQVLAVIVAAVFLRNVWALVVGAIVGRAGSNILSYIYHPYRPRWEFDLSGARHLYRFGKWIGLSAVFSFLVAQGDALTVGKLIDPAHLAFYQVAFSLGTLPAVETVSVLGDILFPLYANIKNDPARLKKVFVEVTELIYVFLLPASVGMLLFGREIVSFIYGARWAPAVPILYVIIGYGFIRSFEYLSLPLLKGVGKVSTTLFNSVIQAAVLFSVIVPLTTRYGAVGTALAALIGLASGQVFLLFRMRQEIHFSFFAFLQALYLPVLASALMAAVLGGLKMVLPAANVFMLLGYVAAGGALYFAILWVFDKLFKSDFFGLIGRMRKAI
jgi:O-antigen/teichoic acid export membrane protein